MNKNIIRGLATLLFGTVAYFTVENYTGHDVVLEDGTTIETKDLKTNIHKEYANKPSIDSVYIYLHHTVTSRDATIEDINQIHLKRGWPKLSYHFAVRHTGKIYQVNGIDKLTYHTKGHNLDGIAVVLIGNFEEYYPTKDMEAATRWIISDVLCKTPNLYIKGIIAHKDAEGAATLCPGKYAYETFNDLFFNANNQ